MRGRHETAQPTIEIRLLGFERREGITEPIVFRTTPTQACDAEAENGAGECRPEAVPETRA